MAKKIIIFILVFILGFFIINMLSLHKNTFVVSGTYLEIISPHKQAAGIVYREFRRLDKIFNFYDKLSEISRLNKTYKTPFKASKEMIEVLLVSKELHELSLGAFDPSCGAIYVFWKDLIKSENIMAFPPEEEIKELKSRCGMEYIDIDKQKRTILIKKKGLKIDLSSIAKGYMVDKAVSKLKSNNVKSALINAGGDIYCLGEKNGKGWTVGIKNPKTTVGVIPKEVEIVNNAIATSGGYEQFFTFKDKRFSHLIDPKTGYPVQNNILSVSVISDKCMVADALATAFSVMGLDRIREFTFQSPLLNTVIVVTKEQTYIFGEDGNYEQN